MIERYKNLFLKTFNFVALKYFGYAIAFLNQLFFISVAGTETYGVYSFFIFLLTVAVYSNCGAHFSYVVLAASRIKEEFFQREVFRSALSINSISLVLLTLLVTVVFFWGGFEHDFFSKFQFTTYIILVFSAYVLKSFSLLLMSRERVKNNWRKINVYYILPPIVEAIAIFWSNPENIVSNVLIGLNVTHVSLILYMAWTSYSKNPAGGVRPQEDHAPRGNTLRSTFTRGMEQNFYNLSFYGILFLVRGFASASLSVADFGRFSFALNLSTALVLFVGSVQFLVQPNIFAEIAKKSDRVAFREVLGLRRVFLLFSSSFFFVSCLGLYIIGFWSNAVHEVLAVVMIVLVAQIIYENSYGVTTILIQRNRERALTLVGVVVIVVVWAIYKTLPQVSLENPLTFCGILVVAYALYSLTANLLAQSMYLERIKVLSLFEPEVLVLGPLTLILFFFSGETLVPSVVGTSFLAITIYSQRRNLWILVKSMLGRTE